MAKGKSALRQNRKRKFLFGCRSRFARISIKSKIPFIFTFMRVKAEAKHIHHLEERKKTIFPSKLNYSCNQTRRSFWTINYLRSSVLSAQHEKLKICEAVKCCDDFKLRFVLFRIGNLVHRSYIIALKTLEMHKI